MFTANDKSIRTYADGYDLAMLTLPNTLLKSDAAENSIMQTITIAVSAILIAAGLVTAPGLISNANDNNATTDLANIAYAEEVALSDVGAYSSAVTKDLAVGGSWLGNQDSLKYNTSGSVTAHQALTCASPAFYVIKAKSKTGKTFYRSSASAKTSTDVSTLGIPACISALSGWATFSAPSVAEGTTGTPAVPAAPAADPKVVTVDGAKYTLTGDATVSYTTNGTGTTKNYVFTITGKTTTPTQWSLAGDWTGVTKYKSAKGTAPAALADDVANVTILATNYTFVGKDRSWNGDVNAANNYAYTSSAKSITFTIQVITE